MRRSVIVSMGSWVGGWKGASVRMWLIECFRDSVGGDPVKTNVFFSPAIPAPLWHGSAYHYL